MKNHEQRSRVVPRERKNVSDAQRLNVARLRRL
jgi:hypothetical protein